MTNSFFSNVPDFNYVNRSDDGISDGDYTKVKNFFKKAKLREDIIGNVAFFEKFTVQGDDRPDNVANEIYGNPFLDWVVLLANNIVNIQSEWPMSQTDFNTYVTEKYENEDTLYNGIHHYEANEVKTTNDVIIIPSGTRVSVGQSVSYFDNGSQEQVTVTNIALPITNFMHEQKINDDKRNIFLLKPRFLNLVFDDMEDIMTYKKGSTQFVDETLVQGDNIRLYD
jgi:hypothetical protein|tara:strand:- start:38 stop:712 length:675 start_codon:yes stop_codon:yes gene_type:complete